MGCVIAERLTNSGHMVSIANSRGPETLTEVSEKIGARAVAIGDLFERSELVIVSIPQNNIPALSKEVSQLLTDSVIVVDTGNYFPSIRDGRIDSIENGMTESGWVSHHLGRKVVKVFNNITAQSLAENGSPAGSSERVALPVAGDGEQEKNTVMAIVDQLGFDSIDAGGLDESWRQQPGTPVYATDWGKEGVELALSKAVRERSAELRELALQRLQDLPNGFSHRDLVAALRSLQ